MRQLIQPHLLGIDTGHAPGFRFDSPGAIDETCLVMCFRTPVRILTRNGIETGAPEPLTLPVQAAKYGQARDFARRWSPGAVKN